MAVVDADSYRIWWCWLCVLTTVYMLLAVFSCLASKLQAICVYLRTSPCIRIVHWPICGCHDQSTTACFTIYHIRVETRMKLNWEVHFTVFSKDDKSNLLILLSSDQAMPMNPVCLNALQDVFDWIKWGKLFIHIKYNNHVCMICIGKLINNTFNYVIVQSVNMGVVFFIWLGRWGSQVH